MSLWFSAQTAARSSLQPPVRVNSPKLFCASTSRPAKIENWLELTPPDQAGILATFGPWLTPNGRFYTYGYLQEMLDLYLVEGLK